MDAVLGVGPTRAAAAYATASTALSSKSLLQQRLGSISDPAQKMALTIGAYGAQQQQTLITAQSAADQYWENYQSPTAFDGPPQLPVSLATPLAAAQQALDATRTTFNSLGLNQVNLAAQYLRGGGDVGLIQGVGFNAAMAAASQLQYDRSAGASSDIEPYVDAAFLGAGYATKLMSVGEAANIVTENTIKTGTHVVYQSLDASGNVNYIGITNDLERRAAEQLGQKGIRIQAIPGLTNLSRTDAQAVEQVLIENYGLGKNGGTLINKINSISPTNPIYPKAFQRGTQILQTVKYPG